MKAQPIKRVNHEWEECPIGEATHIKMFFPIEHPAFRIRYLPIQLSGSRSDTNNWSWNGDTERPTLKPSILTECNWGENRELIRCHTFVNDGIVQFLADCTHENANKNIELMDVK